MITVQLLEDVPEGKKGEIVDVSNNRVLGLTEKKQARIYRHRAMVAEKTQEESHAVRKEEKTEKVKPGKK